MATEPLISWEAPEHFHVEKKSDWYWGVGIVTLALTAVAFMFGQIIPAIFILSAVTALVIHASKKPRIVRCEINDRGIVVGDTLYPFLALDSFWIAHDQYPAEILIKSRKLFMPLISIHINEEQVDPEEVRKILLRYIAETEHHEPLLKHLLERLGF